MKSSLSLGLVALAGAAAISGAAFAQGKSAAQATSTPSVAPAAAEFTAGASVKDSKGVQVATVVSAEQDKVVLDTGESKIAVPASFFTKNDQGLALTITADQFHAAMAKAHARAEAAKAQAAAQAPAQAPAQPQQH